MTETPDNKIFLTLIKEIDSLLSEMEKLLVLLTDEKSNKKQTITELQSLTDNITGIASMMDLHELADTATLINRVLNDIVKDKLSLSPRLIDAIAETSAYVNTYCSSLKTNENIDEKLFQKALSTFSEFGDFSLDSTEEGDCVEEEQEDDFFRQLSQDEDPDDIFEDLDLDIFEDEDVPIDMPPDIPPDLPPEINSSEITDSGIADIDPEFLESFNEESKDHLNNINQQLNLLSPSINKRTAISTDYRDMLHSIRRSVHTLKGAAAVIGLKPVASFGNEFEDFLDWLHDTSDNLSPEIITAMLDGTDILEKLAINPVIKISNDIDEIKGIFKAIMADSSDALFEEKQKTDPDETANETTDEPIEQDISQSIAPTIDMTTEPPGVMQVDISKKLRVDIQKVDQMIGLIGDMSINLSSHEDSSQLLETLLDEFANTMKRMKDITGNLETGFELAEIPHISSVAGAILKEDQSSDIDEFDPLEMDRYSDLHILIRSLNESVADLNSIMDQTISVQSLLQSTMGRQRRVITEIQNSMQHIKMAPFSTLSNRLYKTVRESARVTGKSVQLVLEGDYMEMDTHVWDVLADPLMHLLRNAIDHGIETPEERKKTGKSEQATIHIKCIRRGSRLNMHFSDDGKGLNYDAIRERALKLYPETNVSSMDNDALTALIFAQGFTIKNKPTTISGRGVGMDVVNYAVKQLNGEIEVISIAGKGTEFIIRLPIEVAQLQALVVKFGQQKFAVPLRDITQVFKINSKESTKDDFKLDKTILPMLRPAEIMGIEPEVRPGNEDPFALSVDVGNKSGILVTDAILGKKDLIFKNLGPHLHNRVPCIAGATIMGNGSLVPILNTEELFSRKKASVKPVEKVRLKTDRDNQPLNVLIVDDSISIRKVLSNFISNQGWQPSVAKDGIDAMEMIRQYYFDIILLDIEMPRMNGFDVLQSLQLHSDYSKIPVLMLTSRSAKKYKDRATELGARGFVTKPFHDDELLSLIKNLIDPALPTRTLKTGN